MATYKGVHPSHQWGSSDEEEVHAPEHSIGGPPLVELPITDQRKAAELIGKVSNKEARSIAQAQSSHGRSQPGHQDPHRVTNAEVMQGIRSLEGRMSRIESLLADLVREVKVIQQSTPTFLTSGGGSGIRTTRHC